MGYFAFTTKQTTMGKSNHFSGQCGFHTDFTNYICGGVVKRVIISLSEAVQRLSLRWDSGFNTDFHGLGSGLSTDFHRFGRIFTLCTALTYIAGLISLK